MVDLVATIRRMRMEHRGTYWYMVWKLEKKGRETTESWEEGGVAHESTSRMPPQQNYIIIIIVITITVINNNNTLSSAIVIITHSPVHVRLSTPDLQEFTLFATDHKYRVCPSTKCSSAGSFACRYTGIFRGKVDFVYRFNNLFSTGATNPLWVCILQPSSGAIASYRTRFLDHTQRRATVGRTPLDE